MRSLNQWLVDYSLCHSHPRNRLIHHVCVPAIQFSLLGLLWLVELPLPGGLPHWLNNMATLLVVLAMIFYLMLSWRMAIGALLMSVAMLMVVHVLHQLGILFETSVVVFVIAWVGQFVGHMIEGKRPSFFEDVRFLLIGPLWVLSYAYAALRIPIDKGDR